ncbi:hypothetical protein EV693_10975 [Nicoletella semolina]|uniref:Uncharacterized protein n=1 Tax=Nicoletella semolina TaxID=271160 RepID=A0A4R2N7E8_9PAST|nr:hypothetical protein [Nicoletella semolina]MDH2924364.1 hypothetical protein [Nicoletella semolina]TCP16857.1 hypothetical protein EV693_10975 [Nicoletella semolina]
MKKILLASVVSFVLTGFAFKPSPSAEKTVLQSKDLVGKWACKVSYQDKDMLAYNLLHFTQEGIVIDVAAVKLPIEKPILDYKVERSGYWSLAGNNLSYVIVKNNVIRSHSEKVKEVLQQEKFKNVKDLEQSYFDNLQRGEFLASVNLSLTQFADKRLTFTQHLGGKNYEGFCIRDTRSESQKAPSKKTK